MYGNQQPGQVAINMPPLPPQPTTLGFLGFAWSRPTASEATKAAFLAERNKFVAGLISLGVGAAQLPIAVASAVAYFSDSGNSAFTDDGYAAAYGAESFFEIGGGVLAMASAVKNLWYTYKVHINAVEAELTDTERVLANVNEAYTRTEVLIAELAVEQDTAHDALTTEVRTRSAEVRQACDAIAHSLSELERRGASKNDTDNIKELLTEIKRSQDERIEALEKQVSTAEQNERREHDERLWLQEHSIKLNEINQELERAAAESRAKIEKLEKERHLLAAMNDKLESLPARFEKLQATVQSIAEKQQQ